MITTTNVNFQKDETLDLTAAESIELDPSLPIDTINGSLSKIISDNTADVMASGEIKALKFYTRGLCVGVSISMDLAAGEPIVKAVVSSTLGTLTGDIVTGLGIWGTGSAGTAGAAITGAIVGNIVNDIVDITYDNIKDYLDDQNFTIKTDISQIEITSSTDSLDANKTIIDAILENNTKTTLQAPTDNYTVKTGDNLWNIAKNYLSKANPNNPPSNQEIQDYVNLMLAANPDLESEGRVSDDKTYVLLYPGEELIIPVDPQDLAGAYNSSAINNCKNDFNTAKGTEDIQ
ncbi:MAG: LysM peptidoglycan-binding domain-containing protein, partial [Candidatus Gastranaerophilales bacterium]|nr:LysM peptidoglycan-binding domain-containing protein [Candidatus Gastranaerophilales bacterium]